MKVGIYMFKLHPTFDKLSVEYKTAHAIVYHFPLDLWMKILSFTEKLPLLYIYIVLADVYQVL